MHGDGKCDRRDGRGVGREAVKVLEKGSLICFFSSSQERVVSLLLRGCVFICSRQSANRTKRRQHGQTPTEQGASQPCQSRSCIDSRQPNVHVFILLLGTSQILLMWIFSGPFPDETIRWRKECCLVCFPFWILQSIFGN